MSVKRRVAQGSIIFIMLILALKQNCFAETSLEQYVKAGDTAFEYKLIKTAYTFLYTTYIFEITSQKWHAGDWTWRSVKGETDGKWKHWLRIVEPRLLGQYTQNIPFFSLKNVDIACPLPVSYIIHRRGQKIASGAVRRHEDCAGRSFQVLVAGHVVESALWVIH